MAFVYCDFTLGDNGVLAEDVIYGSKCWDPAKELTNAGLAAKAEVLKTFRKQIAACIASTNSSVDLNGQPAEPCTREIISVREKWSVAQVVTRDRWDYFDEEKLYLVLDSVITALPTTEPG